MFSARMGPALLVALMTTGGFAPGHSQAQSAPGHSQAPGAPGYEQVQILVDSAAAFLAENGPERAFLAFNDSKGKWIKGDLYVFAFDQQGVFRASGFHPEQTGSNAWDLTDAAGIKIVQEIIAKANRNGSGMVDYLWKSPVTGKLESKSSYVVKVGDFIIGSGFYHR